MINVTGGKDGEKVSVELIGSKDEVVREAGYVIEAVAEKIFVKNNGRGFDQATKRERIECICAAYNGMFLSFALDNNLSALARELIRIGVIGSVGFEKAELSKANQTAAVVAALLGLLGRFADINGFEEIAEEVIKLHIISAVDISEKYGK